ncbi:hypothetical protein NL676_012385 [Syzygium grande]|nr:hypothetical protein NL676_012385 [Syzygium grande]
MSPSSPLTSTTSSASSSPGALSTGEVGEGKEDDCNGLYMEQLTSSGHSDVSSEIPSKTVFSFNKGYAQMKEAPWCSRENCHQLLSSATRVRL